ncbi:hypothetical protein HYS03_02040 [Candidatus Woesebacteria bacterium]|nr:hypothetical protein [Candidatus Woesebacteria bacterium]QQG47468.1 MAG: hypothetical protein HY044_05100 [Candidatus Woesebacteria bacterium]
MPKEISRREFLTLAAFGTAGALLGVSSQRKVVAQGELTATPTLDQTPTIEKTKISAAPKVERWMDENVVKDQIKTMRAQVERLDPNAKFIVEAAIPGYNPVVFVADKSTRMQDGHIFTLESFGYNETYTVDDPDGERIGSVEALAKQVRQAMEVASNKNGMIDVWMASGKKNEYGEIVEKREVSKDAPVIIRFGSDRKGQNVFRNGFYPGWNFSYSILDDGLFEIYLDNSFRKQELSLDGDWQSIYISNILPVSLFFLSGGKADSADLVSMYRSYMKNASAKGIKPWIWTNHFDNNSQVQLPSNNASDGDGGDVRLDNIFKLQGRVS